MSKNFLDGYSCSITFQGRELEMRRNEMSFRLADMMNSEMTGEEMSAVVDQHHLKLQEMEDELGQRNEMEKEQLIAQLAEKHQSKLNALQWKHEQLV